MNEARPRRRSDAKGHARWGEAIGSILIRACVAFALALSLSSPSRASGEVPAIIYGIGGKNDKSFSEAAWRGAEAFKSRTGVGFREFEISNDAQREQAMRRFARDGNEPIIAIGFDHASAMEKVAKEFPDAKFAIVDTVIDLPNVRSIVFREHEGSYLVGLMAGMASESGVVGFVGGMDFPLIRRVACGYRAGVKAARPEAELIENMTGTTPAAWSNPVKGAELARSQFARGADVVLQAAGGTGVGVLQAAADAGKLGIGTDSNQNYLHPGSVLTSLLKRVDVAVDDAFTDALEGNWSSGIVALGVKEGGIDYALDEYNAPLVSEEMKRAVDEAKADIASGALRIHDYVSDLNCPY